MNNKLMKYQTQAKRLGVDNINAVNIDILLWQVVAELRARPDAGTFSPKKGRHFKCPIGMRDETTLYEYYVGMILDTVTQIHKSHGYAYLFSLEQIADVIKYEKDARFKYLPESDCFRVSM